MKQWHLWVSIGAVIFFGFLISRDALARFFWQKYRLPEAAILLNKSDANLAMVIGSYYFNGIIGGGEYKPDIALKAYQKAVSIKPGILWGHYQLARVYFIKGDLNNALEEINKELAYNPENLRSLYVRGLIYGYRGLNNDLEKAENDFYRFTEWAPKEWAGYNDLAWVLSKDGKYAEAEKIVDLAFKEIPDEKNNPWLLNSLGVAQLNLKKYSEAASSFEKAKKLAGKLAPADWRRSYPGNNPAESEGGISDFIEAIDENLRRARQNI